MVKQFRFNGVQKLLVQKMTPAQQQILADLQRRFKIVTPTKPVIRASAKPDLLAGLRKRTGIRVPGIDAFSPDEARDERGRWTEGGDLTDAYKVSKDTWSAPARALLDKYGPRGAGIDPNHMTPVQEEKWFDAADKTRKAEHAWEHSARVAMSVGKLSIDDAKARGYYPSGHDADDKSSEWYYKEKGLPIKGWQQLPDTLYHVTTAKSAVLADGLKTRAELSQERGKGLGGGEDDTVSFTTSREGAENLYHTLHEAQKVATGEISVDRLVKAAQEGKGASRPFVEDFMHGYDPKWKQGDPLPQEVQNIRDGRKEETNYGFAPKITELPAGAVALNKWVGGDGIERVNRWTVPAAEKDAQENRFQMYKQFLQYRESAGGPENPVFFLTDVPGLAKTDPSELAIVTAKPIPGAQGYPMGALAEWRTASGKAVNVTGVETPKVDIRACRLKAGGPGSGRRKDFGYAWIDHPELGALTMPYSESAGGAHYTLAKAHDFAVNDYPRGHVWVDKEKKQYSIINYNADQPPAPGLAGRLREKLGIPRDYEIPRPKFTGPYSDTVTAGGPGSGPHRMDYSAAYNPDEARDDKGRWAKGDGSKGNIFVSPNTEENLSFDQAKQALSSPRQKEMGKMAEGVVRELTPRFHISNTLGDWGDGAENSLLVHADIKDPEALDYAAARMGLEAQQKAVIPFSVSGAGKDALWTIRVPGSDLDAIRDTLGKSGLQFRTLEPAGAETLVHVFDQGAALKKQIQTAAASLNGKVTIAKGTGKFLGSWDSREEGAKEYQKVIKAYEGKKLPLAASTGRRANRRYDVGPYRIWCQLGYPVGTRRRSAEEVTAGGPGSGRKPSFGSRRNHVGWIGPTGRDYKNKTDSEYHEDLLPKSLRPASTSLDDYNKAFSKGYVRYINHNGTSWFNHDAVHGDAKLYRTVLSNIQAHLKANPYHWGSKILFDLNDHTGKTDTSEHDDSEAAIRHLNKLKATIEEVAAYSPDEARDKDGKWTDSGEVPDTSEYTGDLEEDLDKAGPLGQKAVVAALKHHDAHILPLTPGSKTRLALVGSKPVVVELDDDKKGGVMTRVWDDPDEFVRDAKLDDFYPNAEDEFNKEFWDSPSDLYHATPSENLPSIMKTGLSVANKTRGMSNRGTGASVYTTTDPDEMDDGSYGDGLVKIDMAALKADTAKEDLPYVDREPDITEGELRRGLAHHIGLDDYDYDYEQGMSPNTIVVHGGIPAKYLTVERGMDSSVMRLRRRA